MPSKRRRLGIPCTLVGSPSRAGFAVVKGVCAETANLSADPISAHRVQNRFNRKEKKHEQL